MKKILWIVTVLLVFLPLPILAEENIEYHFVGGSNIGEFASNVSTLTEAMKAKILNDLALFPREAVIYVKVNSFVDEKGTKEANQKIVIARLNSVVSLLIDLRGEKLEIIESSGHVYVPGENEVNKRFVAIEFFVPKKDQTDSAYAKQIEELKSSLTETVSSNVERIKNDLNTQNIEIKEIRNEIKDSFRKTCLLILIVVFGFLTISWLVYRKIQNNLNKNFEEAEKQNQEIKEGVDKLVNQHMIVGKPTKNEKKATVKIGSNLYRIKYLYERDDEGNESLSSPFINASGEQVKRRDLGKLVESFKGCMKKPEFANQMNNLIANGTIEIITK